MNIEVRLFATFRKGRWKNKFIDFDDKSNIKDILDYLNIEEDQVSIALINGKHSHIVEELKDGDVLALFPPVGGG
ncbi:MAG: MoaD/ThiS family protein [Tissierellia bacterium]|nr:MoaD/ThiS family protein [Tissierellia bacterium]MDD4726504.1 MoaD/ThiS family protein [Tissierellia bacterium]